MKKGSICIILGLILVVAALLLTGYNLMDNYRAGQAANKALEQLVLRIEDDPIPIQGRITIEPSSPLTDVSDEIEYPDYILNPGMDMPVEQIDGKDYIGVISIPAIGRELPVINEWNYTNLKTAPCRYAGSIYLNNMIICAHNYEIHFGSLKHLRYGDTVIFTDMDGNVFTYKVMEIETLQPRAIEEMKNGEWDLTMFTCTIGGASRITVRCERTDL